MSLQSLWEEKSRFSFNPDWMLHNFTEKNVKRVFDEYNGTHVDESVILVQDARAQNYTRIAVSIFVIFIVFIGWRYMRASQQR